MASKTQSKILSQLIFVLADSIMLYALCKSILTVSWCICTLAVGKLYPSAFHIAISSEIRHRPA